MSTHIHCPNNSISYLRAWSVIFELVQVLDLRGNDLVRLGQIPTTSLRQTVLFVEGLLVDRRLGTGGWWTSTACSLCFLHYTLRTSRPWHLGNFPACNNSYKMWHPWDLSWVLKLTTFRPTVITCTLLYHSLYFTFVVIESTLTLCVHTRF
jgi:hypothetical protein